MDETPLTTGYFRIKISHIALKEAAMKRLIFLTVIITAGWYGYHHYFKANAGTALYDAAYGTGQGEDEESGGKVYVNGPRPTPKTGVTGLPYEDRSGLPDRLPVLESGDRAAYVEAAHEERYAPIGGCRMYDESGGLVDFSDVLDLSRGRILVVDLERADSFGADGTARLQALGSLQERYADSVTAVCVSLKGNLDRLRAMKTSSGAPFEFLSMPPSAESMLEKDRRQAFLAGAGDNAPATLFIRDGKYVVRHISGPSGYEELERALKEALKKG